MTLCIQILLCYTNGSNTMYIVFMRHTYSHSYWHASQVAVRGTQRRNMDFVDLFFPFSFSTPYNLNAE